MKINPVGNKLFHANGQTDVRKLIVGFNTFSKAPNTAGEELKKKDSAREWGDAVL
jgi:hypothetical protein